MSAEWRWATLECPVCRRPVEVPVEELIAGRRVVCPRGHPLPTVDLSCSGLRETVDAIAGIAGAIERHRPDPSEVNGRTS